MNQPTPHDVATIKATVSSHAKAPHPRTVALEFAGIALHGTPEQLRGFLEGALATLIDDGLPTAEPFYLGPDGDTDVIRHAGYTLAGYTCHECDMGQFDHLEVVRHHRRMSDLLNADTPTPSYRAYDRDETEATITEWAECTDCGAMTNLPAATVTLV